MKIIVPITLASFALAVLLFGLRAGGVDMSPPLADAAADVPAAKAAASVASPEPAFENAPVAVVELFTSEGCSSCPPADRLLYDLADRDDARLFPLAFHVDYWNRLGWTDPFSDAAHSQRQRAYARAVGSGRVYTPQMVVNGEREFVGSRRAAAEGAIQHALSAPALATIELHVALEGSEVRIDYAVTDAPDGAALHLALVQRRAEQAVPRGENAGRTLRHANVVRAFETVGAGEGSQTLGLPSDLDAENAAVVAYAQVPDTKQIVGASRLRLSR
jgi:hypothetical protein